jgi:hypothetical protein
MSMSQLACCSRMRKSLFAICLALSVIGFCASARAKVQIVTFDAPGAGTASGQGTFAFGISPAGEIEGDYLDASNVYHGYVRSPKGAITIFDVSGAGTGPSQGTLPQSINPAGAVTGYYTDSNGLSHGFMRAPDGTISTFDAPGAGTPMGFCVPPFLICSSGTQAASINPAGVIAGQYVDASAVFHGFVRAPDGTITTFDAPGAGAGPGQGTYVTFTDGINPEGAIAGGVIDANGMLHATVRAPDGTFTTFDPPGSVFTQNSGINPVGTVTSFYADASFALHGYIRASDGTFTFFDVAGGGTGPFQGTLPFNINTPGDITGIYIDANGVNHGFLRLKRGLITKFDVSAAGSGSGQGTIAVCNNPADVISGFYLDAKGVAHGFMRLP